MDFSHDSERKFRKGHGYPVNSRVVPLAGDQSLTLQIDAPEEAGCERFFQDQVSGIVNARPNLSQELNFARLGDTLTMKKFNEGKIIKVFERVSNYAFSKFFRLPFLGRRNVRSNPWFQIYSHVLQNLSCFYYSYVLETSLLVPVS